MAGPGALKRALLNGHPPRPARRGNEGERFKHAGRLSYPLLSPREEEVVRRAVLEATGCVADVVFEQLPELKRKVRSRLGMGLLRVASGDLAETLFDYYGVWVAQNPIGAAVLHNPKEGGEIGVVEISARCVYDVGTQVLGPYGREPVVSHVAEAHLRRGLRVFIAKLGAAVH